MVPIELFAILTLAISLLTSAPSSQLSGPLTAVLAVIATFAVTRSADAMRPVTALAVATGVLALALVPFVAPEPIRVGPLTPPVLLGQIALAPLFPAGFVGALAAPAALAAAALAPLYPRSARWMWVLVAALTIAVLASGSRSAMAAGVAGVFASRVAGRSWAPRVALLALPVLTLAIELAAPAVDLGRSVRSRIALWIVTTWLSAKSPAGIGFGAFADHGVDHLGREVLATTVSAHNLAFQAWADLGPIGIVALLGAAVAAAMPRRVAVMPDHARRLFVSLFACAAVLGCTESVITVVAGASHATIVDPLLYALLALPFGRWLARENGSHGASVASDSAVGT